MAKRFLITTAEESSWLLDRPILFLGEWCRLYKQRNLWEGIDAEVVSYHWDDREQYYQDYSYLKKVYEEILRSSTDALNTYHGTNYSVRFWRIVIGPWLYKFINILFDRWVVVHKAASDYSIDRTIILKQDINDLIPSDMDEYIALLRGDKWNNYIIGEIIKKHTDIKWDEKKITSKKSREDKIRNKTSKLVYKLYVLDKLGNFLSKFTRKSEIFVINTYLPLFKGLLFQIYLGQFPKLWRAHKFKIANLNLSKRSSFNISTDSKDIFVKFASEMTSLQIPVVYLEGYRQLVSQIDGLPWPPRPKIIFTSSAYETDEAFKVWAATKAEFGVPLVIGQHGGFFGVAKWTNGEDHQIAISDRFLTWGWKDSRQSVFPAIAFTDINKKKIKWNNKGGLLFVTVPMSRYSWKSDSSPVGANQSNQYTKNHVSFIDKLPQSIRNKVTLRSRVNWDKTLKTSYTDRLRDAHPEIRINPSTTSINSAVRNCRIFISGYNATTYLYSLNRNIPTIMFWDPSCWELRNGAQPFFDKLKQVGIFHESSESAAKKVKDVWDNVEGWWYKEEVQEARREFCVEFAYMPKTPFKVLKNALNVKSNLTCRTIR